MMDRRFRIVLIVLLFIVGYTLYRNSYHSTPSAVRRPASGADITPYDAAAFQAANATLGFGAVVAVSRAGSPRRPSLLLASNITEIDITIPAQPTWTDDDLANLRSKTHSTITRGSALAWLGHLNALRWFLASDLQTMLILEDDVDWDIHLRTQQIPVAASAVRRLLTVPVNSHHPLTDLPHHTPVPGSPAAAAGRKGGGGEDADRDYWGDVSKWDILYLGHCGDIFRPSSWTPQIPRIMYDDPTLLPRRQLHPYTSKFLESISVPDGVRMMHKSIFPLCTFGFAVTRAAAHRLLTEIAATEAEHGTMAYDVRVLEACRDLGFRCWSANPELFHHVEAESEIAVVNEGQGETGGESEGEGGGTDKAKAGADEAGRLKPLRVGSAPNIACGARSKQFYTESDKTLEFLRQKVGREGMCLRDELEDDAGKDALRPYDKGQHFKNDPRLGG